MTLTGKCQICSSAEAKGENRMDAEKAPLRLYQKKLESTLERAKECIARLNDEDINWCPNRESNSIAWLVLHMAGNLAFFLNETIMGKEVDHEQFRPRKLTKEETLALLESSFSDAIRVLDQLPPEKAGQSVRFRGKLIPVSDLVFNTVVHQAEYAAQIICLAKQRLGASYQRLTSPYLVFSGGDWQLD
jgi:hypothetical protein